MHYVIWRTLLALLFWNHVYKLLLLCMLIVIQSLFLFVAGAWKAAQTWRELAK
jgi:hypothetical protein